MPRIKRVFSKVYDVPRRPFEKERLDQVRFLNLFFDRKLNAFL